MRNDYIVPIEIDRMRVYRGSGAVDDPSTVDGEKATVREEVPENDANGDPTGKLLYKKGDSVELTANEWDEITGEVLLEDDALKHISDWDDAYYDV